jgi:hypothetical protein
MFYQVIGEKLQKAGAVYSTAYRLEDATHSEFTYPIDGWYWFTTDEEAVAALGLPVWGT